MRNLRLGIIGTGFITDTLCEAAGLVEGVEISAVYSRKVDTGCAYAQKHGIKSYFTSLADMLDGDAVDAVYVASPTVCHYEHTLMAARAKKHILCEKSMSVSQEKTEEMIKVAREEGVILLEAMRPAFDPMVDAFKAQLANIGKVRRFGFEFRKYSSRYDKFKAGIVENAFDPSLQNSALSDIGVYPLWLATELFGVPKSLHHESVYLHNGFLAAGEIILGYSDTVGNISYSKITEGRQPSFVEGECGTVFIDKISEPQRVWCTDRDGKVLFELNGDCKNNMIYELIAFRDAVLSGERFEKELSVSRSVAGIMDTITNKN